MFKKPKHSLFQRFQPKRRNSNSAKAAWNDMSEFATPNVMKQCSNYLINQQNLPQISSFNPFDIKPFSTKPKQN